MAMDDDVSNASLTGFVAEYTSKDLILYALSIGFGSSSEQQEAELRYLFERHRNFCAVPCFPLVLPFWADRRIGSSQGINSFPPPMMKAMGVLPKKYMRVERMDEDTPVIHVSQSITWNKQVPVPDLTADGSIRTDLRSCVLSVAPKPVGTFAVTQTEITLSSDGSLLCTLETTNLVLGMPPEHVMPFGSPRKRRRHSIEKLSLVFEWTYDTVATQALLYRMASGDANRIHVDASSVSTITGGANDAKRPLLHGLCSLGIALRGIIKFLRESEVDYEFHHVECQFTKPALVGDSLLLRIWKEASPQGDTVQRTLIFKVLNNDTNDIVIDHGIVLVALLNQSGHARSHLRTLAKL